MSPLPRLILIKVECPLCPLLFFMTSWNDPFPLLGPHLWISLSKLRVYVLKFLVFFTLPLVVSRVPVGASGDILAEVVRIGDNYTQSPLGMVIQLTWP